MSDLLYRSCPEWNAACLPQCPRHGPIDRLEFRSGEPLVCQGGDVTDGCWHACYRAIVFPACPHQPPLTRRVVTLPQEPPVGSTARVLSGVRRTQVYTHTGRHAAYPWENDKGVTHSWHDLLTSSPDGLEVDEPT